MDLSIYKVIKGPLITDKAHKLNQDLNQLVLEVHPRANKSMISEALFKLFSVKADKIRIVVHKGKTRRAGKFVIKGRLTKKAIITVPKGMSAEAMSLSENAVVTSSKETDSK